ERAVALIDKLIALVVALESQKRGTPEARLALRRGVALLDRMRAANELPRPMAVMLPFFDKRLGEAPEVAGVKLSPGQRRGPGPGGERAPRRPPLQEERPGRPVRLRAPRAAEAAAS